MNIGAVKIDLEKLGISTSTPGLTGDERFEELAARLKQSQGLLAAPAGKCLATSSSNDTSNLGNLSIGELRSRLTALGESTDTPGLTGEERWNALMKRLVQAICGSHNASVAPERAIGFKNRLPVSTVSSPATIPSLRSTARCAAPRAPTPLPTRP